MSVEESKWMKKGFFSAEMGRLRVFYFFTPCQLLGKGFFSLFSFFSSRVFVHGFYWIAENGICAFYRSE